MKAIYINLDRSIERRSRMEQQAAELGIHLHRITAVDGKTITDQPDFNVSSGALGCFYSHRAAWSAIACSDGEYTLVLEDDVHLSPDLPDFLSDTAWIPADTDLIHLEWDRRKCEVTGRPFPALDRRIWRTVGKCSGGAAYIISTSCARKLFRDFTVVDEEFDQTLFNGGSPNLTVYKLIPALGIQDTHLGGPRFTSTIDRPTKVDEANNKQITFLQKIRRESLRIIRQIKEFCGIKKTRLRKVEFQ